MDMQNKIGFGVVELPVFTYLDEDMYVSEVPFVHVASQGKTVEESLKNLKEAIELYFEDEDVEKLLKEKLPTPSTVITTSLTFDVKTKHVVNMPVAVNH